MRFVVRFLLLALGAGLLPISQATECPLLVVADRAAPVDQLHQKEIRRLYLGVPHQTHSGLLQPARNTSDSLLEEVFLQKILFMSRNAYRRALAKRLVQQRKAGPAEYENVDELIEALYANPRMISYIWTSSLPTDNTLKVLLDIPCENDNASATGTATMLSIVIPPL